MIRLMNTTYKKILTLVLTTDWFFTNVSILQFQLMAFQGS